MSNEPIRETFVPQQNLGSAQGVRLSEGQASEAQSSVTASKVDGGVSYRIGKDSTTQSRIDVDVTQNVSGRNPPIQQPQGTVLTLNEANLA